MTPDFLRNVLESAMLAAGRALTLDDFLALFEGSKDAPDRAGLRQALGELGESLEGRAVELVEVASGYRLQVRQEYSAWLGGLFAERPPRYSRALLETLALIAYRQPITRGEIEDVRGVAVSSNIIKTLMEREWIRVLGHREVPGRPALFGTTREFLDHFGLKSLDGLPPLAEIRDLEQVEPDLFAPLSQGPTDEAPSDGGPQTPGDAGEVDEDSAQAASEGAPRADADGVQAVPEDDEGTPHPHPDPHHDHDAGDESDGPEQPAAVDSRGDTLAGDSNGESDSPGVAPAAAVPVAGETAAEDEEHGTEDSLELGGAGETDDPAGSTGEPVTGDVRREG